MRISIFFFVTLSFLWLSCQSDSNRNEATGGPVSDMVHNPVSAEFPSDTSQMARLTFEVPEYDFGTVNEGDIVEYNFKFTNTGKVPLTIFKARSSCGCTIPEWPEDPIPPGGTGEIKAKFTTEGKMQTQSKTITVTANTNPNETKVKLSGFVNPSKDK